VLREIDAKRIPVSDPTRNPLTPATIRTFFCIAVQVSKALHLDYQSTAEERTRTGHPRPYDYFLLPMRQVLGLKTSIYDPPEAPELQALLLVESAKEARTSKVKADCLMRAFDKLSPLPEVERHPEQPASTHAAKARAVLWGDVVSIAAGAKLHALVGPRLCT
jgi:hypothetical protein